MTILHRFAFVCLAVLFSFNVSAQTLKPQVLSDTQALLRVPTAKKYLLIPVEENANMDHVRVISDNNVVREFNVRLSVNKADYYVPLEVSGIKDAKSVLLDINFNRSDAAPSASKAATADFACWKLMSLSDTFDVANREAPDVSPYADIWLDERPKRPLLQGRLVACLFPAQPIRLAVGEHDVGTFHVQRPCELDV